MRLRHAVQPFAGVLPAPSLRGCGAAARTQGGRGHNGCRVGESILVTGTSQNLSRGSDTLCPVFEAFVKKSPISVMVRGLLERVLSPKKLDEWYDRTVDKQYTRNHCCPVNNSI